MTKISVLLFGIFLGQLLDDYVTGHSCEEFNSLKTFFHGEFSCTKITPQQEE